MDQVNRPRRCLHRRHQATCRMFAQYCLCGEKRTISTCVRVCNCNEPYHQIFQSEGLLTSRAQPPLWRRPMLSSCRHHGARKLRQEGFQVQQSLSSPRNLRLQGTPGNSSDRSSRQRDLLPHQPHRHHLLSHTLTIPTSLTILQRSSRRLL